MKTVGTVLITLAVLIVGAIGFAYSGFHDVSASKAHSGLTDWFLRTVAHASVEKRANQIEVPNLDDAALLLAGINDYEAMCAGCHGAPGRQPTPVSLGLNPPAPDLSKVDEGPAELFWVTKHGIRMTGMPAWGATHDDAALWPVVAFVLALPKMNAQSYNSLLAEAEGIGHHQQGPGAHEHGPDSADQHDMADQSAPGSDSGSHEPAGGATDDVQAGKQEHDHSDHPH